MYKTIWMINYENSQVKFTQYHFGKAPRFPSWYMEEDNFYEIEMLWNLKLISTFQTFIKCLFKQWKIQ